MMYGSICYSIRFLLSSSHVAVLFIGGTQPLGFASQEPFGVYLWHAYVPPGDGPWPMSAVHHVTHIPWFHEQDVNTNY